MRCGIKSGDRDAAQVVLAKPSIDGVGLELQ